MISLSLTHGRRVRRRHRRAALAWLMRCAAGLATVGVAMIYYAEARFSVVTSYRAAGSNNPFVRFWNDAPREMRSQLHYVMWAGAALGFIVPAVVFAFIELLGSEQSLEDLKRSSVQLADTRGGGRLGKIRWHLTNRKASLALTLVMMASVAIWVGRTWDRAGRENWGSSWDVSEHGGRAYWLIMLERSSLYAGMAGLLPMTLIGIPLGRTSALW